MRTVRFRRVSLLASELNMPLVKPLIAWDASINAYDHMWLVESVAENIYTIRNLYTGTYMDLDVGMSSNE
jgi:3-polyprenyl-4-hydroxybenzoate decarboxylase